MSDTPYHWPSLLRDLDASERAWNTRNVRYSREDAVPWLPYPRSQFIALLTDAVEAAPVRFTDFVITNASQPRFLDVGCGTGTKLRLAQALFGLEVQGIDIVPEFVAEANAHHVYASRTDAFEFQHYDMYDIVYVNRPSTMMAELERCVMEGMAPGAVLMLVNGLGGPELEKWTPVSQEWGTPVQGCWIKP